ncbi:hypothetical protein FRC20_005569 [Serendipita sp. 405]|nr:hypothetical protein FRC20_005569 [Serendipita sp. 405]
MDKWTRGFRECYPVDDPSRRRCDREHPNSSTKEASSDSHLHLPAAKDEREGESERESTKRAQSRVCCALFFDVVVLSLWFLLLSLSWSFTLALLVVVAKWLASFRQ